MGVRSVVQEPTDTDDVAMSYEVVQRNHRYGRREREGMRKREGRERKEREKMRREREIAG